MYSPIARACQTNELTLNGDRADPPFPMFLCVSQFPGCLMNLMMRSPLTDLIRAVAVIEKCWFGVEAYKGGLFLSSCFPEPPKDNSLARNVNIICSLQFCVTGSHHNAKFDPRERVEAKVLRGCSHLQISENSLHCT